MGKKTKCYYWRQKIHVPVMLSVISLYSERLDTENDLILIRSRPSAHIKTSMCPRGSSVLLSSSSEVKHTNV